MTGEYAQDVVRALWWLVGVLGASVVGLGYIILHGRGQALKEMRQQLEDVKVRIVQLEEWRKLKQ